MIKTDSNTESPSSDIAGEKVIDDTERCLSYERKDYCKLCKDVFDLYEGECIRYTFYIRYEIYNSNENIKLFNEDNINNLKAIKVEDKINGDITNPYLGSVIKKDYIVYYYFQESTSISLSNMFKDNTRIQYFTFDDKYMNNFIISNMSNMFAGFTSLKSV